MSWLASLTGVDVELLRALTAICSLCTAVFTGAWTILGLLNRRRTKAAAADALATKAMVEALVQAFGVAKPEAIAAIAREAAVDAATEQLAPVHDFLAAWELVESRREHSPETDVIRILQLRKAAA